MSWPNLTNHAKMRCVERTSKELTRDFNPDDIDWKTVRYPNRLDKHSAGDSFVYNDDHELLGLIPKGQGKVVTVLSKEKELFEFRNGKWEVDNG